ncbi:MAG: AmmeMemoRadiSam system radical SAM enzyme [Deltaproteobacteria bacterium]|nr:AmmeMemoRadiSam system radical SAM enzyme [Deltaproteobacteria bacterium]
MLWQPAAAGAVKCGLCPHRCVIKEGRRGVCMVRENRGGVLFALNYGRVIALHVDPIEKKPLFHYLPGSTSLSLAATGCNLLCRHCQNASISQWPREHAERADLPGDDLGPDEVIALAREHHCASISYTYTEPTIFAEYALDVVKPARETGIGNVFVTNGYMTPEFVALASPILDAANVDLKSSSDEFYKKICGARVGPVKEAISLLHRAGVLVEVTTLVIPGYNDSDKDLRGVAAFLAGLSPDIPWHVSRFHPDYRLLDAGPTPRGTLDRARRIGKDAGLKFIYAGNVPGDDGEHTSCPGCGARLIERVGFRVRKNRLREGHCPECATAISGRW